MNSSVTVGVVGEKQKKNIEKNNNHAVKQQALGCAQQSAADCAAHLTFFF